MRYIVIFLLLANVAYFGWNSWQPLAPAPVRPEQPLVNSGLTLVAEFETQARLAAQEADQLCSLVTGFADAAEADDFITEARALGLQALVSRQIADAPSQYRVFLPPNPSTEIARLTLADLVERLAESQLQVETYLITRGELQNAVALGVFDTATAAVTLRDQVAALGYSPQIEQIQMQGEAVQVWLQAPESGRVDEPEWLDLTGDRPNLARVENLCQTIAQASQFQ